MGAHSKSLQAISPAVREIEAPETIPLSPAQRRKIRNEARAFMVWREGSSVAWDCTVFDLSEATGLSVSVVRAIACSRRWPFVRANAGRGAYQVRPLTRVFPGATDQLKRFGEERADA